VDGLPGLWVRSLHDRGRRREEEALTDRELAAKLVHAMRVAGLALNVGLTAHF
jgi:hypothetical protein